MSEIDGPSVGKTPPDVFDVEPKHDYVRFLASGCPRDLDFRFVDITAHNFPDPMKFELLVDLIYDYMKNGLASGASAAEDGVPLAPQYVAKRAHSVKGAANNLGMLSVLHTAWCVELLGRTLSTENGAVPPTPELSAEMTHLRETYEHAHLVAALEFYRQVLHRRMLAIGEWCANSYRRYATTPPPWLRPG